MIRFVPIMGVLIFPCLAWGGTESSIRLTTTDGVTLRGEFYPGTKKSACVLILHDLKESHRDKEWHAFAGVLAKKGFAVLRLNFRGFGRSTEVDSETFWSTGFAANRNFVKSASKDEIAFSDFDDAYHPYLINDIATAKAYLDRKNDAGECNSSNLILVSSGKSGALAAAWINAEMHRYRQMPPPFFGAPIQLAPEPEGASVIGALFVNLSPQIGKRKIALGSALQPASKRGKLPAVFFYARGDKTGKNAAKQTEKAINPSGKYELTGVTELPEATADNAEKRFLTDGTLQKDILRYLNQVQEDRSREWQDRDASDAVYYWRNPYAPGSLIPFNQTGNPNPPFVNYELFTPAR